MAGYETGIKTNLFSIIQGATMLRFVYQNDKLEVHFVISGGKDQNGQQRFTGEYAKKDAYTLLTAANQAALGEIIETYIKPALEQQIESPQYCIPISGGDTSIEISTKFNSDGILCPYLVMGKKLTTTFPEKYDIFIEPIAVTVKEESGDHRTVYVHSKLDLILNRVAHPERIDNNVTHAMNYKKFLGERYYGTNNNSSSNGSRSQTSTPRPNSSSNSGGFMSIPDTDEDGLPFN